MSELPMMTLVDQSQLDNALVALNKAGSRIGDLEVEAKKWEAVSLINAHECRKWRDEAEKAEAALAERDRMLSEIWYEGHYPEPLDVWLDNLRAEEAKP